MGVSRKVIIRCQSTPLVGSISVPGDKSISHRAVMLAALAEGTSVIRNWLPAGDTLATLEVIRALGVPVEVAQRNPDSWELRIEGRGLHGLRKPNVPLDCRNAGTGIRLLTGIMSGQSFSSILDGSEQLRKRPMGTSAGIHADAGLANMDQTTVSNHLPVASNATEVTAADHPPVKKKKKTGHADVD